LDHKAAGYNELQELLEAMEFLVQIESTKESDNTIVTGITTTTSGMMMLNPPTLVELSSDSVMNATNLRCSPPRLSNQRFDKEMEQILRERTWASSSWSNGW
jgi:hypothetical protein